MANNAQLGTWQFLNFIVSSSQVLSFKDLQLTGSCETEDKESGKAQWVVLKKMKPYELSTTIVLNRRMGVTDVQGTAEKLVQAAREGWYDLFTINGRPVINQLSHPVYWMMTSATVSEIEIAPDGTWISCSVKCQFKFYNQGGTSDSKKSSGGGGSGSKKSSSKSSSSKKSSTKKNEPLQNDYEKAQKEKFAQKKAEQAAKKTTDTAKKQSTSSKKKSTPSRAKHVEFNPTAHNDAR